MASFISNPIAYGVRSDPNDKVGGPLDEELIAGANVTLTQVEVPPGSGNLKIQIASTGGGGGTSTYVTTSNPTVNNDSVDTAGIGRVFAAGEYWLNTTTKKMFYCNDATPSAAIWVAVDARIYYQVNIVNNTTTDVDLGDKVSVLSKFLNYRIINTTLGRARTGQIYVGHNGTTAELSDEYTEINGTLNITTSALIDGSNHVILRFTAGAIGSDSTLRYTEETLA